ncbi:MAG TPA: hypothetical protein VHW23_06340 [Kofleriaceae bacterium]|jgi:hypothetical protein|nr:hypothetical protein [Kofleriaceae bacterium]
MRKLILLALLTVAACSDSSNNNPPPPGDAGGSDAGPPSDQPEFACFSGTATTHDQLINACVDQSVTAIVKYKTLKDRTTALPLLLSDGSRPPLP